MQVALNKLLGSHTFFNGQVREGVVVVLMMVMMMVSGGGVGGDGEW